MVDTKARDLDLDARIAALRANAGRIRDRFARDLSLVPTTPACPVEALAPDTQTPPTPPTPSGETPTPSEPREVVSLDAEDPARREAQLILEQLQRAMLEQDRYRREVDDVRRHLETAAHQAHAAAEFTQTQLRSSLQSALLEGEQLRQEVDRLRRALSTAEREANERDQKRRRLEARATVCEEKLAATKAELTRVQEANAKLTLETSQTRAALEKANALADHLRERINLLASRR